MVDKDKKNIEDILPDIFQSFSKNRKQKSIESFNKNNILNNITKEDIGNWDPEEFWYKIIYKQDNYNDWMLHELITKNEELIYIYKNFNNLQSSFSAMFNDFEGMSCSSDKGSTVLKNIIKYYQVWKWTDYDYNQEYTFNLPKKIFKEKEMSLDFYKALKNVMYGWHKTYLNFFIKYKEFLNK